MLVSGRVQGVCYRAFVRDAARKLGLAGLVRNLPDGRVEVEAQGDDNCLHDLLHQLAAGPPAARVEEVRKKWLAPADRLSDFRIAPD